MTTLLAQGTSKLARHPASRGIASTGLGLGLNMIIQVVTVSILVRALGAEQYGIWIMLTTIPSYLSMADFGLAGAAATEATIQGARARAGADFEKSRMTISAAWTLMLYASLAVSAISVVVLILGYQVLTPPWSSNLPTVILLILSTLLWLHIGFVEAAFRANQS